MNNRIIEEITKHKLKIKGFEKGTGSSIANSLLNSTKAAKNVMSWELYCNPTPYKKYLNHGVNEDNVAFTQTILEELGEDTEANCFIGASFKLGGKKKRGWVGIKLKGESTYYRIIFPENVSENMALRKLGQLVPSLLLERLDHKVEIDLLINKILGNNLEQLWKR